MLVRFELNVSTNISVCVHIKAENRKKRRELKQLNKSVTKAAKMTER